MENIIEKEASKSYFAINKSEECFEYLWAFVRTDKKKQLKWKHNCKWLG